MVLETNMASFDICIVHFLP